MYSPHPLIVVAVEGQHVTGWVDPVQALPAHVSLEHLPNNHQLGAIFGGG